MNGTRKMTLGGMMLVVFVTFAVTVNAATVKTNTTEASHLDKMRAEQEASTAAESSEPAVAAAAKSAADELQAQTGSVNPASEYYACGGADGETSNIVVSDDGNEVSVETVDIAKRVYSFLSSDSWKTALKNNGWKIVITNEDISLNGDSSAIAEIDKTAKEIRVEGSSKAIYDGLIHEIVHWATSDYYSETGRLALAYEEEGADYVKTYGLPYENTLSEYVADAVNRYTVKEWGYSEMKEDFPKTFDAVEELLGK